MSIEETVRKKSIEALIDKGEECKDLAETQHLVADKQYDIADKQHETAAKLHALGTKLISDAVELEGKVEENSKRFQERPDLQMIQKMNLGNVA